MHHRNNWSIIGSKHHAIGNVGLTEIQGDWSTRALLFSIHFWFLFTNERELHRSSIACSEASSWWLRSSRSISRKHMVSTIVFLFSSLLWFIIIKWFEAPIHKVLLRWGLPSWAEKTQELFWESCMASLKPIFSLDTVDTFPGMHRSNSRSLAAWFEAHTYRLANSRGIYESCRATPEALIFIGYNLYISCHEQEPHSTQCSLNCRLQWYAQQLIDYCGHLVWSLQEPLWCGYFSDVKQYLYRSTNASLEPVNLGL